MGADEPGNEVAVVAQLQLSGADVVQRRRDQGGADAPAAEFRIDDRVQEHDPGPGELVDDRADHLAVDQRVVAKRFHVVADRYFRGLRRHVVACSSYPLTRLPRLQWRAGRLT
jgi:hypothetical protein